MSGKKKRPGTDRARRREAARSARKVTELKEKLFALEAGGAPERAIEVASASVIESHAESLRCPRCDNPLRVREHAAVTQGGERLREVRVACPRCGAARTVWFRLRALH